MLLVPVLAVADPLAHLVAVVAEHPVAVVVLVGAEPYPTASLPLRFADLVMRHYADHFVMRVVRVWLDTSSFP